MNIVRALVTAGLVVVACGFVLLVTAQDPLQHANGWLAVVLGFGVFIVGLVLGWNGQDEQQAAEDKRNAA